jgi:hypothetical protein
MAPPQLDGFLPLWSTGEHLPGGTGLPLRSWDLGRIHPSHYNWRPRQPVEEEQRQQQGDKQVAPGSGKHQWAKLASKWSKISDGCLIDKNLNFYSHPYPKEQKNKLTKFCMHIKIGGEKAQQAKNFSYLKC